MIQQFQFEKVESYSNDLGEQTSRFLLNGLAQGQGLTIGNTLRRVLLTELKGTAITAVRINGINNEFATIPGVREDVLEILLNLKQIKFKGLLDVPFLTHISVQGPQIITAGNIDLLPELSVLNPRHYIATLSEQINIELELKIESNTGYQFIDEDCKSQSLNFLNIDSIFTPVKNVNYQIKESYRVDEKLTEILDLEIITNGSITPNDALNKAAQLLETLFGSLVIDESTTMLVPQEELETELDILIEELQLSVRAYNCLKRVNIKTIDDLVQYSVKELKEIKNFGQKSANEVIEKLQNRFNICLR
jgi:DNA-directed RNA polymerase subunit alpha|tara:strand:+ start:270 stop:1190 length:921 start_codon:yes stop_codon:yes gene_type:complete